MAFRRCIAAALLLGLFCTALAEDAPEAASSAVQEANEKLESPVAEIVIELGGGTTPEDTRDDTVITDDFANEVYSTNPGDYVIPYPDITSKAVRKKLTASKRVYPGALLWPLPGTKPLDHVTSHVGWRNAARIHGSQGGTWPSWLHHGVDVGGVTTAQSVVAADGGLAYAGYKNGCGRYVVIDHGNGWYTEYQHLSAFAGAIFRGCRAIAVSAGDPLGYVGNSGGDYPVHFHFEIAWSPKGGGSDDKKYFRQTKNRTVRAYSFDQEAVVELHWAKTWEICTAERQQFVTDVREMGEPAAKLRAHSPAGSR